MKFLILLTIIGVLTGTQAIQEHGRLAPQTRSVSSIIVDILEAFKVHLTNGYPALGIPSMAPLKMAHKEINYESGDVFAKGAFDDIEIHGLNEFEIKVMDANLIFSRIKYELLFASLNLTTQYAADVGAGYHLERKGGAFMALENMKIYGQIKYSTGLGGNDNYFRIGGIQVNIAVDKVVSNIENLSNYKIVNRKLNEIVEEFINIAINENTELVADWIDNTVTPICNDMIGDRTLKDLLDLVNGGGGSN